jgi:hypothetical protein
MTSEDWGKQGIYVADFKFTTDWLTEQPAN